MDREALVRRKVRIERLLPFVAYDRLRALRLAAHLRSIDRALGLPDDPERFRPGPAREAEVDGRGTLRFEAQGPPGLGRLVRIPFLLTEVTSPDVVTDAGPGLVAQSIPTVLARLEWALGNPSKITNLLFETRPIEWADLRVVGFVVSQRTRPQAVIVVPVPPGLDNPLRFGPEPALLVKDLSVGGGANLFPQEGYADAVAYSASVPEFPGLRDDPILRSPNTASVRAAVQSVAYGNPAAAGLYFAGGGFGFFFLRGTVTFSLALVCEVLADTSHGMHVPGPYARRDAIDRRPGMRTQGFVA